ncbi:polyprenyl synthetase family protein [Ehrlichia chaffeensis str. Heartland]|uniref:Octaprenyl-diphosphate synthase n=1 Tax=Ehrlichia chaffeensis (strain ATCC CRL-10679 / Arkansas) TaxID=205920 RepID=Q2GI15_EHRCR|nr:polyprenyl synthetase family protein [Ehrlichia chaffeensis]ABD44545.1 octaprenyl-diphosphate synthase [Ehrlichia chaffeensis str. Arkansas]AHX04102.1 polyprenyl synthetase family protein [Ehrlichia chaffeensis str. Heartland]AHX06038.1 polyprenyl synthetase family protein [Ehrlichia chaffeensis str. Jax]AHX07028.1 polyprenyl synthetase family protein [Ehrlichia chaffeensis str. Liberty]AHX07989.1 polyprenyl synthetase family protein [Ehrlichia chaffeensis str. Osceola]
MTNDFSNTFLQLKSLVQQDLDSMESLILHQNNKHITLITEIVQHLIKSGGKRIRPIIFFIICKMLNCNNENKVPIAAAIELIHNATLLHDDVIDESELRRGEKTSNVIWGNKASILVGDFLLAISFQWLIKCKNLNILSILSQASKDVIVGEVQQMISSHNINISKEKYIEIISAKTAALFSATCESAANLAQTSNEEKEALKNFGNNFGISFQIMDDILDYTASGEQFGKKLGNDLLTGKTTLPVIIAYQNATSKEKKFWDQISVNPNLEQAISYIKVHNAIEKSISIATTYINQAKSCLNIFAESNYKTHLNKLLDCILYREC